jgi:hypothetical protein
MYYPENKGVFKVESQEFISNRKKLDKTQTQMAKLLGTSLKAIHSYEQGWRNIPSHIERQLLFLVAQKRGSTGNRKACWTIMGCSPEVKKNCPAWEFKSGKLCWFINGTICKGTDQEDWQEKMKICRSCEVLMSML